MTLYDFLSGAVAFGFIVCALFFVRFWHRTGDQLFIWFAAAFALLGAGQTILALGNIPTEARSMIFLLRLAAFSLIIVAILKKNRNTI